MQVATYTEWKDTCIHSLKSSSDPLVTCPNCNGTGSVDKECTECWRTQCHDCELCDGTGEVEPDDIEPRKITHGLTEKTYREQLLADLVALAHWRNTNPAAEIVAAGFSCYSRIADKQLHLLDWPASHRI